MHERGAQKSKPPLKDVVVGNSCPSAAATKARRKPDASDLTPHHYRPPGCERNILEPRRMKGIRAMRTIYAKQLNCSTSSVVQITRKIVRHKSFFITFSPSGRPRPSGLSRLFCSNIRGARDSYHEQSIESSSACCAGLTFIWFCIDRRRGLVLCVALIETRPWIGDSPSQCSIEKTTLCRIE